MKPISRISPFTLLATGLVFGIVFGSAQHFKAVPGEALHTLVYLGLAVAYLLVFTAWLWGAVAEEAKPPAAHQPDGTSASGSVWLEFDDAGHRLLAHLYDQIDQNFHADAQDTPVWTEDVHELMHEAVKEIEYTLAQAELIGTFTQRKRSTPSLIAALQRLDISYGRDGT